VSSPADSLSIAVPYELVAGGARAWLGGGRLGAPVVALNYRKRAAIVGALETAPAFRDLRDALAAKDA
jgi:hypothetical protein